MGTNVLIHLQGQSYFLGMKDVWRGCKRGVVFMDGFLVSFPFKFLSSMWILKTNFFYVQCKAGHSLLCYVRVTLSLDISLILYVLYLFELGLV